MITWGVSIIFVLTMLRTGLLDRYFIFIPEYIIAVVLYTVLAGLFGAREDYSVLEEEEEKFQNELRDLVDSLAEKEMIEAAKIPHKNDKLSVVLRKLAFVSLAVLLVMAIMCFTGSLGFEAFKTAAFVLTIIYFILNGTATFINFKNERHVLQ